MSPSRTHVNIVQELDGNLTGPVIIRAADLMTAEFPPVEWLVPGLLPEGTGILAGAPKIGKSWFSLGLGVGKAHGGYVLGKYRVTQCDVLYLALEDTPRRLQNRLRIILGDDPIPAGLMFATDAPRMDQGGDEWLRTQIAANPGIRLVIIDTLAKFRTPTQRGVSVYEADYQALGQIKRIADDLGVSIICVHHTTKSTLASDPLDLVSGSHGVTGAVDTILVMGRERGQSDATLYVRGRDVEEADLGLSLDTLHMQWAVLGTAQEARLSRERMRIVEALRDIEPATPKQIADVLGEDGRGAANIRQLLAKLLKEGVVNSLGGKYRISPLWMGNTSNSDHSGDTDHSDHSGDGRFVTPVIAPLKGDHSDFVPTSASNGQFVIGVTAVTGRETPSPAAVIDHSPADHKAITCPTCQQARPWGTSHTCPGWRAA